MGLKIKRTSCLEFLKGAGSQLQEASELGGNLVLLGWQARGPEINKSAGESDQH